MGPFFFHPFGWREGLYFLLTADLYLRVIFSLLCTYRLCYYLKVAAKKVLNDSERQLEQEIVL